MHIQPLPIRPSEKPTTCGTHDSIACTGAAELPIFWIHRSATTTNYHNACTQVISRKHLSTGACMGITCSLRRRPNFDLPPSQLVGLTARQRWQWAFNRVRRLLRLRRFWHYLGLYLQREEVKTLTNHLERVSGVLRHKRLLNDRVRR